MRLIFFYPIYLIFVIFLILEIFFRIAPTSSPLDLSPVTSPSDVLRYKPYQTSTFSLGANFYKVIEKSTNNYGFFSSIDYEPNSKPDIMVIGDSYVEAVQVKNEDSFPELISKKNKGKIVYQLGIPGVALSQYIQMIKFSEKEFSPKHYIITIVGNDFDESLCKYKQKLGTWCYNDNFELDFIPFEGYSFKRSLARKSAFLRYLVFNLNLNWRVVLKKIGLNDEGLRADIQYAGNTERVKSEIINKDSLKVIDHFFEEIFYLGLHEKITIVLDADRQDIYLNNNSSSYFRDMREYVIKNAISKKINIIDMEPIFKNHFNKNNQIFEFPTDAHWNEIAHGLVAKNFMDKYHK